MSTLLKKLLVLAVVTSKSSQYSHREGEHEAKSDTAHTGDMQVMTLKV